MKQKAVLDKSSILGVLLAFGLILLGQALEGGHVGSLLQLTAFLIVFGGTFGAVLIAYSPAVVKESFVQAKQVWKGTVIEFEPRIEHVVRLAQKARKDGIISLEKDAEEIDDPFFKRILNLAVDGTDSRQLRDIADIELGQAEHHGMLPAKFWENAGGYAPTVGILGAVLGLIHVMENLADPSKLGSGIAVAFVATVYGVGSANLLFLPISLKLKERAAAQMALREMTLEGIVAIVDGENPRLIEQKLRGYVQSHGPAHSAKGAAAAQMKKAA
ncbi:MAG: flagellar motor protein MotA [Myxococcales bacterium]